MNCLIRTLYHRLLRLSRLFDHDAGRCMLLCSQVEITPCRLPLPLQIRVDTTIRDVFHRGSHFYFPITKSGTDKSVSSVPSLEKFMKMCFTTYPATPVNIQNAFACLQRLQTINNYFEKEGGKHLVLSSFREYCRCVSSELRLSGVFTVSTSQRLLPFNFGFLRFTGTDTHEAAQFLPNEASYLALIGGTSTSYTNTLMTRIANKIPGQLVSGPSSDISCLTSTPNVMQILLAHPNVRDKNMFAVVLLVSVSLCGREAMGFVLNVAPPSLIREDADASSSFRQKLGHFAHCDKEKGRVDTVDTNPLCSTKCLIDSLGTEWHPIFTELSSLDPSACKEMNASHDRPLCNHETLLAPVHLIHCVADAPGATLLATGIWLDGDKDFLLRKLYDGTALKEDFIVVHHNSIRHWNHGALQEEIQKGKWLLLQSTAEGLGNNYSEAVKEVIFTLSQSSRDDADSCSTIPFDLPQHSSFYTHNNDSEHGVTTENVIEDEGDKEFNAGPIESTDIDDEDIYASVKEATITGDNTDKDGIMNEPEGAIQLNKTISEVSTWSRYYILDQLDPEDLEMWSIMAAWSTADDTLTSMEKYWRLMYYILGSPFDALAVQRTFVSLPMLDEDEEGNNVHEWRALAIRES
ncbi:unnamed protein product [Phytomonas sp. Hart1]|nr:unnamed protein product [Phytomonas sp. Hart1]|eukprot:CCW72084.1 unnamed protein product [Phytomonas sp. isolate Hart1]